MSQMANGAWKKKVISPTNNLINALEIKEWLLPLIGDKSIAVVVRDDWYTDADPLGTLLTTYCENGTLGWYTRRRNGDISSSINNWIASYSLSAYVGDTYTVFYQD